MSVRNLDRLLEPSSIAVIGASDRPGSVGATVWRNLRGGNFAGALYPVNPRHSALEGVRCFAAAQELPVAPDLAIVCTPPETVAPIVDELGTFGVKAAIVMTAGIRPDQKQAMLAAARPHTLRLLGPNCIGLLTPRLGLNASFAHTDALPGSIAFVSQSGAIVTAVLDWAKSRRIGFSTMVSVGDRADVDFGDLLDHLASDAATRSILLYIESIEAPRKFMSAARAAARNKPVIVVKAGRAGQGVRAAASHTGALAGSDIVFDAALRRAGTLRVDTLQDLFVAAETLAHLRTDRDNVLLLMTNGGGAGVMAADAAALAGVPLPDLAASTLARLEATLPPTWSGGNPVDIIGDAPVHRYVDTLETLIADPANGAVLFMHAPTAIVPSIEIARACAPLVRAAPGRVMACWLGDAAVAEARAVFVAAGAADYSTPEEAVRACAMLATFRRNQELLLETPTATEYAAPDVAAAQAIVARALAARRSMLDEFEAKEMLRAYRIPIVPTVAVEPLPEAAVRAAGQIGYPVAIKILSPEISHKSDAGGVALDLADAPAVRSASDEMLGRIARARPDARITGFTVQQMVRRPFSVELIVGASVDPLFGPVLLFGQGGTAVEVIADRAVALPPLNRILAADLVSRTRVSKLLGGYRNHPEARLQAIHDVLIAVSQMLADLPQIAELDINPLWADAEGVLALDARIRLDAGEPAGAARFAIAPYPVDLCETVDWRGEQIVVRPIRPEDEPQHRAFVERLDPNDLRLRFFYARRDLPRSELARLTQIDYAREMAFIAVRREAAQDEETIGVARAISDPDNVEAEFAIIVRSDLKGRGLGHLLLTRLIDYLGSRGTQRMVGQVLRENQAMRKLAADAGFTADAAGSNADSVRLVKVLAPRGAACALDSAPQPRPGAAWQQSP